MGQPYISTDLPFDRSFLTAFLGPFMAGPEGSFVGFLADIVNTTDGRLVLSAVQMLEALRQIRLHPHPHYEPPQVRQLEEALSDNEKLSVKIALKRAAIADLKASLAGREQVNRELQERIEESTSETFINQAKLQYELAQAHMQRVSLEERLGVCEVDLMAFQLEVRMNQLELSLANRKSHIKTSKLAQTAQNKATLFQNQIETLQKQLGNAQEAIQKSSEERSEALKGCGLLEARCGTLKGRLVEAQEARAALETKVGHDKASLERMRKEYDHTIDNLRRDLEQTRQSEVRQQSQLHEAEARAARVGGIVAELEAQLTALRQERLALLDKLQQQQQQSQQKEEQLAQRNPRDSILVSKVVSSLEAQREKERSEMLELISVLRQQVKERDEEKKLEQKVVEQLSLKDEMSAEEEVAKKHPTRGKRTNAKVQTTKGQSVNNEFSANIENEETIGEKDGTSKSSIKGASKSTRTKGVEMENSEIANSLEEKESTSEQNSIKTIELPSNETSKPANDKEKRHNQIRLCKRSPLTNEGRQREMQRRPK